MGNVQGGGACECPRVGAFFKLMTSRGQCPRGGGGAPGVPPIQVQTPPPPPGWLATGLMSMTTTTSYNVQVAYMYLLSLGYYNNTTVLLYIYYNLPPGSIDSSLVPGTT